MSVVVSNAPPVEIGQNSGGFVFPAIGNATFAAPQNAISTSRFLISAGGGKQFHITSFDVAASGSETITIVSGTGSNCGTGQAALWGPDVMIAGETIARGGGIGDAITVAANQDVCVTSTATAQATINGEYAQY